MRIIMPPRRRAPNTYRRPTACQEAIMMLVLLLAALAIAFPTG